jgi:hypothetical protein
LALQLSRTEIKILQKEIKREMMMIICHSGLSCKRKAKPQWLFERGSVKLIKQNVGLIHAVTNHHAVLRARFLIKQKTSEMFECEFRQINFQGPT